MGSCGPSPGSQRDEEAGSLPGTRGPTVAGPGLGAQMVKNLPAVQETRVRSLEQDNPLEEGMATHASILAWRIPWTEEPGRLQSAGPQSQTQLSATGQTSSH